MRLFGGQILPPAMFRRCCRALGSRTLKYVWLRSESASAASMRRRCDSLRPLAARASYCWSWASSRRARRISAEPAEATASIPEYCPLFRSSCPCLWPLPSDRNDAAISAATHALLWLGGAAGGRAREPAEVLGFFANVPVNCASRARKLSAASGFSARKARGDPFLDRGWRAIVEATRTKSSDGGPPWGRSAAGGGLRKQLDMPGYTAGAIARLPRCGRCVLRSRNVHASLRFGSVVCRVDPAPESLDRKPPRRVLRGGAGAASSVSAVCR